MPIKIPRDLPAHDVLTEENIFVMEDLRAASQDIRPLRLAVLNLMPTKITTETQIIRVLSNTPLQIAERKKKRHQHARIKTRLAHVCQHPEDLRHRKRPDSREKTGRSAWTSLDRQEPVPGKRGGKPRQHQSSTSEIHFAAPFRMLSPQSSR